MVSHKESNSLDTVIQFILAGLRESTLHWFEEVNLSKSDIVIVIEKILEDLDRRWMTQDIPLTVIYVASRIIEDVVNQFEFDNGDGSARIGTVILGTMQDDYHSLGKNLVKKFLMPFFNVYDLGVNVKVSDFISSAQKHEADIIAVSTLMMNSVLQLKSLRESIDKTEWRKKPKFLVGGAPFTIDPELFRHTGADAFAPSALVVAKKCMSIVGAGNH